MRVLDKWLEEFHPRGGTDSLNSDVEEIEGIGPAYRERLRAAGVTSVLDLWMGSTILLSNKTGIQPEMILRWQKMADLMKLEGVGPQYSEMLVASGIDTIQQS